MVEDKEKLNSAEENVGVTQTAIRAFYLCIVLFAIIATLATLLFPSSAMTFYEELDNIPKAYQSARFAVRTSEGEDKVNAMIACVNYGSQLFEEEPDKYADDLYEDCTAFLQNEDCVKRSVMIDEYNIENSAKALHPNLYSYLTYVSELKARCAVRLGKQSEIAGYVTELQTETSLDKKAMAVYKISAVYYEAKFAKTTISVDEDLLVTLAKEYFDLSLASIPNHEKPSISGLYYVKAYEKLSARMTLYGSVKANEITTVNYGSEVKNVHELYSTLLIRYCE